MNKLKLSLYLDIIFYFITSFLLSFVWIRFYSHDSGLIISLSIVLSLFITILLTKIKLKKINKSDIANANTKIAKNFSNEMLFLTEKEQCEKICELLSIPKTNIKKKCIIYKNCIIKPFYENFTCSKIDIIKFYKTIKEEKVKKIICCAPEFDKSCFEFNNKVAGIELNLVNENEFFNSVLKTLNYKTENVPEIKKSKKEYFKSLASIAFNQKRAKSYFLYALLLFFCSLFFRYNIYYVISCSIFIIFAIIAKFNKKFNIKKSTSAFNFNDDEKV